MSFRIRDTTEKKDIENIDRDLSEVRKEVNDELKIQESHKKSLVYNYKTGKWIVINKK